MTLSENHITEDFAGTSLQTALTGENTAHRTFILAGKYVLHRFIVPTDKSATPSISPIPMHRKWSMIGK